MVYREKKGGSMIPEGNLVHQLVLSERELGKLERLERQQQLSKEAELRIVAVRRHIKRLKETLGLPVD